MGCYIPKLSPTSLEDWKDFQKDSEEMIKKSVEGLADFEKNEKLRSYDESYLQNAKDSAELSHLYVRDYHKRRNPASSQRANNCRTALTLGGIMTGVMLRATSNIVTGE